MYVGMRLCPQLTQVSFYYEENQIIFVQNNADQSACSDIFDSFMWEVPPTSRTKMLATQGYETSRRQIPTSPSRTRTDGDADTVGHLYAFCAVGWEY